MVIQYDYEKLIFDMKQYVKDNDLTLRKFAKDVDTNASVISRILNKKYKPGTIVVEKIVNTMGKTVSDYFIEPLDVLNLGDTKYDLTIEQIDGLIADLINLRNEKIQLEIERLENQKKEIDKSIIGYEKLINKEDGLL